MGDPGGGGVFLLTAPPWWCGCPTEATWWPLLGGGGAGALTAVERWANDRFQCKFIMCLKDQLYEVRGKFNI